MGLQLAKPIELLHADNSYVEVIPTDTNQIVEVPKDPGKSHPYRQKEVIQKLKEALPDLCINQHHFRCVVKAHGIRLRPECFYRGTVKGSPAQYSPAFVDWLIQQYRGDQQFFVKAKAKAAETP